MPSDTPLELSIDISFIDESTREIGGRAHRPAVDRENEVILKSAIEEALEFFMHLPVIHVRHTERPCGVFTEARVADNGDLFVKGRLKDTPDTDDVWEEVKAKRLNSFSIYGRRIIGSPECSLPPHQRKTPCVSSKIFLDSISICEKASAINPDAFLEVLVKAMTPEVKKATDTSSPMIHTTVDGAKEEIEKLCKERPEAPPYHEQPAPPKMHETALPINQSGNPVNPEVQKCGFCGSEVGKCERCGAPWQKCGVCGEAYEKAEEGSSDRILRRLKAVQEVLSRLVESDKKVHSTMEKSTMAETTPESKTAELEKIAKAEPEAKPEAKLAEIPAAPPAPEFAKAELVNAMEGQIGELREITKAQAAEIAALKDTLKKAGDTIEDMKKRQIEKSGPIVVIPADKAVDNPALANKKALEAAGRL